jgi:CRP/FNR family cyclic AMP-dependent transcriptional regulator
MHVAPREFPDAAGAASMRRGLVTLYLRHGCADPGNSAALAVQFGGSPCYLCKLVRIGHNRSMGSRENPDSVRAAVLGEAAVAADSLHGRGLAERGQRRNYRKGTLLIQEGDRGDSVFYILTGHVKVFSVDADGREFTYNTLGPGDYFGEMSLDGGERSASVITMEACECAVLSSDDVRAHLAVDADFAFELLTTVISRARHATIAARSLALGGVYSRLAAFLEKSARLQPNGERMIEEVLTQVEIASRIGSSREMVSRIMKDLEAGGYVETRVRKLVLKKRLPEKW